MSRTGLLVAGSDGNLQYLERFENSWRGAMWIWNYIARKYCGLESFPLFNKAESQRVWDKSNDPAMTEDDYLALLTTFDHFLVGPEHIERVAQALESIEPGTENLKGQAAAMRSIMKVGGVRAIGWHQTSVCENPWEVYMPGLNPNDEGISRPYCIDMDSTHHWIIPRDVKTALNGLLETSKP